MFGAIELVGNKRAIPRQNGIGFGDARHLGQGLAPESFADLGQGGSFRIGPTQAGGSVCAQNSILGSQIVVLDEQFVVDEAGNVREQAYSFALFHLERPEYPACSIWSSFLTLRGQF